MIAYVNIRVMALWCCKKHGKSFVIDNDASLELIAKTAVSQAKAGADIIARVE